MSSETYRGWRLDGMNATDELYSKLSEYLEKRISLRDLESWLVPRLPVYLDAPSSPAGQLVGAVELLVTELHSGLRTERSVRVALRRCVSSQRMAWFKYPDSRAQDVTSFSESRPVTMQRPPNQLPAWHIEFAGVVG